VTDEDDYRRLEKKGAELFQRWCDEHSEAAREKDEMRGRATAEDLDACVRSTPKQ